MTGVPMPRSEALLLVAAVAVAAAGCSKLTFVKPSAERKGGERVAPDYSFKETRESRSRQEARRHASAAGQHLRAGDVEAAAEAARLALAADAGLPEPHTAMASVAMRQGQTALAGRHYAEAARLAPSGSTYNNLGAWLCFDGRAAESLRWFDEALGDPRFGDRAGALANAGACAAKAGEWNRVERDLRAALDLEPENAVALAAMARYKFGQGEYFEARAFSERRLAAGPADAATLELASRIEEKLGDSVAAARYVQRLRTEFPQAGNALPGESSRP